MQRQGRLAQSQGHAGSLSWLGDDLHAGTRAIEALHALGNVLEGNAGALLLARGL